MKEIPVFQSKLMQGQRILVTGGGTGLGQAMAENFLALGADVAICGRRKSVCDETAQAWREKFPGRRIDTFGVQPDPASRPQRITRATLMANTTSAQSIALSRDLKRRGWTFVGPTTVYAFMQAMGLVNDHIEGCATRDAALAARTGFTVPV